MDKKEKITQNQFHDFVFGAELSWQEIIYDLINTEQLDPWDIDLSLLAQGYLEKIQQLEEANFAMSSKVLLVASLILRIKSELLISRYIRSLDDVLFNKKHEIQEKIEIPETYDEEFPGLLPKSPMPRLRRLSLPELMAALSKAVKTEERREYRKENEREAFERTRFLMPKKTISLKDRIKKIYDRVVFFFQKTDKIKFSELAGEKKHEKINTFIPLLHLDNHNKLWLQQHQHFDEIWIHKDGREFMQKGDIIPDNLEEQFEEMIEENKWESLEEDSEIKK